MKTDLKKSIRYLKLLHITFNLRAHVTKIVQIFEFVIIDLENGAKRL